MERRLFKVDVGAVYTVTALSPAEALGLVLFVDGDGDNEADVVEVDLSEIDREAGASISIIEEAEAGEFWDDGEGAHRSVWAAHLAAERSEVIACSEWP